MPGAQIGLFDGCGHELADRLPREACQDTAQLAAPEEQRAQHLLEVRPPAAPTTHLFLAGRGLRRSFGFGR